MNKTSIHNCPKCLYTKWYIWTGTNIVECCNCGFEEMIEMTLDKEDKKILGWMKSCLEDKDYKDEFLLATKKLIDKEVKRRGLK